jgi:SAM-dependent methyltransferase
MRMTDAQFLMGAHDAFDLIEGQFNEALDESLDPTGPKVLYEYVGGMELKAGAITIDVGSGEGEHVIELARRFRLEVTGIDPVVRCVEFARSEARPEDNVSFKVGVAQNMPVASASADLLWCRDVLSLVGDLGSAYREFRRVLKPEGRALIYQTFATSLLEPRAGDCRGRGLARETMRHGLGFALAAVARTSTRRARVSVTAWSCGGG